MLSLINPTGEDVPLIKRTPSAVCADFISYIGIVRVLGPLLILPVSTELMARSTVELGRPTRLYSVCLRDQAIRGKLSFDVVFGALLLASSDNADFFGTVLAL